MKQLEHVLEYATEKHKGQTRWGGEPYITHPIAVSVIAERFVELHGQIVIILAYLHDVIEDCFDGDLMCGYDEVREKFGKQIADILFILTHDPRMSYTEYIQKIVDSGSIYAIVVKISDLEHNLSSCYRDRKANKARITKYELSKAFLEYAYEILMGVNI